MTDEYSQFFDEALEIAEDAKPSGFDESRCEKEDGEISFYGSFDFSSVDDLDIPRVAKRWVENEVEYQLKQYYDFQEAENMPADSFAEFYEMFKNGELDPDEEMNAIDAISSEIDITSYITINIQQDTPFHEDLFEITVDCVISSMNNPKDEYLYGPVKITCYPKEYD